MTWRKNVSGQTLYFLMISSTDGSVQTGKTVTVKISIDQGAQGSPGGSVTETAGGQYYFAPSQADTNGNSIGILLTCTGCVPQHFQIFPTAADPTDAVHFGLSALPAATPGAAGGLFIAGTNAPVTITGSGDALTITSTAANGNAVNLTGQGSGNGLLATPGATGAGIKALGGATSGDAINAVAATSGHGITATGAGTTKHGINANGGATSSDGIRATGGGVGNGVNAISGGGVTGDGIKATSVATNGNGANLLGNGTGNGALATGGAGAGGDGIECAAGGGVDLRVTSGVTGVALGSGGIGVGAFASNSITAAAASAGYLAAILAALNLPEGIKKNQALSAFPVFMVQSVDHVTGATGLTVAGAVSIDGGAFNALTNTPCTEVANGLYKIDLAAADLNGTIIDLKFTAATADARIITIKTSP